MVSSIHRDDKQLDRAGVGTTSRFVHLTHEALENLVYFSLLTDTYSHASGMLWSRIGAIPMGGLFSAQSADIRSIWGAKQRTDLMRRLGNLSFSPRGHPLWTTPRGNVLSLAQFRDNVLVGAKGPTARHEMQHVCHTLTKVWSLPVLCGCMTEEQQVCTATCMTHTMTAMGIITHVHGQHPPLVYPQRFTSQWHLKYTVTLQSPTGQAHTHISSIIVGAVLNVQPFLHSWVACLLSITSWAQLASLSGYSRPTVLCALHSALPRIVTRTPRDVDGTLEWCRHIAYVLPRSRDTVFYRLRRWIVTPAVWTPEAYASWHLPCVGPSDALCADWCHNFPILDFFSPRQDPREPIHAGLCPPGGGGSRFPIVCELSDCSTKVGPIREPSGGL